MIYFEIEIWGPLAIGYVVFGEFIIVGIIIVKTIEL